MKKHLLLFFLLNHLFLFGQFKVEGIFQYNIDLNYGGGFSKATINCTSHFNKSVAFNIHQDINSPNETRHFFVIKSNHDTFQLINLDSKKMLSTEGKKYWVDDFAPKINWKIGKETKKIGNYLCKNAIAKVRGRNYTAWFCPQIPSQMGPWKLYGCPGLILEANDEKGEVSFTFVNLEFPIKNDKKIELPVMRKEVKRISFEEFKELKLKKIKNSKEIVTKGKDGNEKSVTAVSKQGIEIFE